MDQPDLNPQAWLQSEFRARRAKNGAYSLRRMAQQLGIPSGRMSELLNGRRRITVRVAEKICSALKYDLAKRQKFMALVTNGQNSLEDALYTQLSADAFQVLADWHHFAILSVMDLDDFDPAPKVVGARLGISSTEVRESYDRLLRLGLIERQGQSFRKTSKDITTTHDIESAALRISHKQNLELAARSLDEDPVSVRDVTSITMAIDIAKLPAAKAMIKKFRRSLCRFLESDQKNEVFNLNIQLFPLTMRKTKYR